MSLRDDPLTKKMFECLPQKPSIEEQRECCGNRFWVFSFRRAFIFFFFFFFIFLQLVILYQMLSVILDMTLSSCDSFSSISNQAKTKLKNRYCVSHIEHNKLEEIIYVSLEIFGDMLKKKNKFVLGICFGICWCAKQYIVCIVELIYLEKVFYKVISRHLLQFLSNNSPPLLPSSWFEKA